jgi:hypothetical protein
VAAQSHVLAGQALRELAPDLDLTRKAKAFLSTDPDTTSAIVFLHGFGGHPVRTWHDFPGAAARDESWHVSDLYFLGFRTSSGSDIDREARRFLDFLKCILPEPPAQLFAASVPHTDPLLTDTLRPHPRPYDDVCLVGHSLGGVVLRKAVLIALGPQVGQAVDASMGEPVRASDLFRGKTTERCVADANLRLFAPAIGGVSLSRFLGLLHSLPLWFVLNFSAAYGELKQGSSMLNSIRDVTNDYASKSQINSLVADICWAEHDSVISKVEYARDRTSEARGRSHSNVCKPAGGYVDPLTFVKLGCQG